MEIIQLTNNMSLLNRELHERAQHSSLGQYTTHYVVYDQGLEVAFLSLDHRLDINVMVIYEIYLPEELRGSGIGTRVLLAAEAFAKQCGFSRTLVRPAPLVYQSGPEKDRVKAGLIRWYEGVGYRVIAESGFTEWQKEL